MNKSALTRMDILQKAAGLIYKNGFQATSIDAVIASTNVTKGAFFYHFKNKDEMGLAMIEQILTPGMHDAMISPLEKAADPIATIYQMMENLLTQNPFFKIEYGCPAINLVEEMAPLNEAFATALGKNLLLWQSAIRNVIIQAKNNRKIKQDTDPEQVAIFITAGYAGIRNIGKIQGQQAYQTYLNALKTYLDALKS